MSKPLDSDHTSHSHFIFQVYISQYKQPPLICFYAFIKKTLNNINVFCVPLHVSNVRAQIRWINAGGKPRCEVFTCHLRQQWNLKVFISSQKCTKQYWRVFQTLTLRKDYRHGVRVSSSRSQLRCRLKVPPKTTALITKALPRCCLYLPCFFTMNMKNNILSVTYLKYF